MIFLRAFPFSFDILWRFAIVLPLLLIGIVMVAVLAVMATFFFGLISPLIGLLIVLGFGLMATVLPVLVGLRLGLQAKRVRIRNTYLGLLLPAVGYGALEAISVLMIFALLAGGFLLASPLTFDELMRLAQLDPSFVQTRMAETNPALFYSAIGLGLLLMLSLRTALLVPLAGASIGRDPNGYPHTPFYGFGSGFFSLLAIVIFAYVAGYFVIPVAVLICISLGMGNDLERLANQIEFTGDYTVAADFWPIALTFFAITLVMYLWLFSLQCAGAVLIFKRFVDKEEARKDAFVKQVDQDLAAQTPDPMRDEDMMNLIRSRMPGKKYDN